MKTSAEKLNSEQIFLNSFADFEAQRDSAASEIESRLSAIRRAHLEHFKVLGLPTKKTEEWKYTQITPYLKKAFSLPKAGETAGTLSGLNAFGGPSLTFVNGQIIHRDLADDLADQGVHLVSLAKLFAEGFGSLKGVLSEDEFFKHLEHFSLEKDDVFRALNGAFINDGYLLWIKPGAIVENPIHIHFISQAVGESQAFAAHPRNLILVGQGAQVSVVESFQGQAEAEYFMNSVTDAFVAANAVLRYSKTQTESLKALHVGEFRAELERDAQLDTFSLSLGAKLSRHNLKIKECGEGVSARVNGLYLAQDQQHVDNRTVIHHAKAHGHSEQLYKGVLTDKARAVFNGKIYIDKYAQKVDSSQLNKNLILGDKAEVDTKPELEVYADDVKASHGATVGQMSEEELFYIMSRAISRSEAVAMLSRGFVKDVLYKWPVPEIRIYMDEMLTNELGGLEKSIEAKL